MVKIEAVVDPLYLRPLFAACLEERQAEYTPEQLGLYLLSLDSTWLAMAKWNDQLAGFLHGYSMYWTTYLCRVMMIGDLYVLPHYRRHGVATKLLEYLEHTCRHIASPPIKHLVLETSLANEVSGYFYHSRGFQLDSGYVVFSKELGTS